MATKQTRTTRKPKADRFRLVTDDGVNVGTYPTEARAKAMAAELTRLGASFAPGLRVEAA